MISISPVKRNNSVRLVLYVVLFAVLVMIVLLPTTSPLHMQGSLTSTPDGLRAGSNLAAVNLATNSTDLTFSNSASGPAMTYFPVGTTQIFARWNFQNVSPDTRVRRMWYRDGQLFLQKEDPWVWGPNGTQTQISIYDFQSGLLPGYYHVGLASGNYQLAVFLRDYPQVMADTRFTIGDVEPITQPGGPLPFYNLSFSTSSTGPATAIFPRGTQQVFARWDYHFVPANSGVLRRWYRNGVLFIEKQEPWTLGAAGTVQNVSIYDFQNGLLPGDYSVEFYLIGHPDLMIRGFFTIS